MDEDEIQDDYQDQDDDVLFKTFAAAREAENKKRKSTSTSNGSSKKASASSRKSVSNNGSNSSSSTSATKKKPAGATTTTPTVNKRASTASSASKKTNSNKKTQSSSKSKSYNDYEDDDEPTEDESSRVDSIVLDDDEGDNDVQDDIEEQRIIETKLKQSFQFTVAKICERELESLPNKTTVTSHAIKTVSELLYQITKKEISKDLFMFSKHAKRQMITAEDVLLLARKNDSVYKKVLEKRKELQNEAIKSKNNLLNHFVDEGFDEDDFKINDKKTTTTTTTSNKKPSKTTSNSSSIFDSDLFLNSSTDQEDTDNEKDLFTVQYSDDYDDT